MLDQVSPRRGALELYIDAGPLARDIGHALGRVRLPEIPLVLAAGALLGVALAGLDTSLGSRQVLFATVGAVVVITGLCWSGPVRGRFGWLLPALVRVMEYAFVIRTTAVIAGDLEWLAYAYLVVIADVQRIEKADGLCAADFPCIDRHRIDVRKIAQHVDDPPDVPPGLDLDDRSDHPRRGSVQERKRQKASFELP